MIWVRVILALSAVVLFVATGLILKKVKFSLFVALGGIALNLVIVIANWIMNGYVPFISMYQVLAFVGVCFPLTYLFIKYVRKTETSFAWFTLCEGVCMFGCQFMYSTMVWQRAPALQSVFFMPHILCSRIRFARLRSFRQ